MQTWNAGGLRVPPSNEKLSGTETPTLTQFIPRSDGGMWVMARVGLYTTLLGLVLLH